MICDTIVSLYLTHAYYKKIIYGLMKEYLGVTNESSKPRIENETRVSGGCRGYIWNPYSLAKG